MKKAPYFSLLLLALCFALPGRAFAAVLITEIMYDLPGSDSGREWVEVTNTGSDAVDISGYKLNEGGTNHALTISSGAPTLAGGQSAVIASNIDKFLADWPQYTGTLFKSSFSLSNTGETVSIKDSSLNLLDSASYTSDGGAAGDGNTLHRVGDTLVAGAPDPGVYSSAVATPTPAPTPAPDPAPTPAPVQDTTIPSDTTQPAATTTTVADAPPSSSEVAAESAQSTTPTSVPVPASSAAKTTVTPTPSPQVVAVAPVATHAVSVASVKKSPAKNSTSKASASSPFAATAQAAAADMPAVPDTFNANNPLVLYGLLLAALIALGVAGSFYFTRPVHVAAAETNEGAEEFEVE